MDNFFFIANKVVDEDSKFKEERMLFKVIL